MGKFEMVRLILSSTFAFLLLIFSESSPVEAQMMGGGRMCGTMERMPKSGIAPKDLPDAETNGAMTYARFCSQCHPLPSPKRNSADDWKTLVERMDKRMHMMSRMGRGMMGMMRGGRVEPMSQMNKETIVGYLQKNALKTLDEKHLASMDTPEYISFQKICSQCHALPDPSLYKKFDWSEVVQRMIDNMEEAGIPLPSLPEKKQVISFLKSNSME
jgi:cytochrome c5